MSRLLNYLPMYERNSKVFQEILKVEEAEFDKLHLKLKDLEKQFTVDTATWGLAIYEKELRLPINPNKSLADRRSIIKAKMRGIGKVDYIMIKAIVEAFVNGDVEVKFNGKIVIIFNTKNEPMSDLDLIRNAIDEIKPAHLDYELNPSIHLEPDEPTKEDIKYGYKGKLFMSSKIIYANTLTIYPYAITNTEIENKEFIAVANASISREITIYQKGSEV